MDKIQEKAYFNIGNSEYYDISNIAYVVKGDKTSKIGYDFKDGKKVRVAKATGEVID